MRDPKSEKFERCPIGCGGTDIRVHFSVRYGKPTPEEDHLHWCVSCGGGWNPERGFVDAMIFGSCLEQIEEERYGTT